MMIIINLELLSVVGADFGRRLCWFHVSKFACRNFDRVTRD